jgi:citrate synthase
MATDVLKEVRGMSLPINVDGVIGAIIGDMKLNPKFAKALFILGRVSGLSAHYFEEIGTQPPMRRINFSEAVYRGPGDRKR